MRPAALLVAVVLGCAAAASGEEPAAPRMFSLRGFGTLGAVHTDLRGADFVATQYQDDGVGFTRRWSAGVDSKLGVQVDAVFNDRFSAVVQLVAQQRYDGSFTPQVEWANLKYQVTPDFSVRVGRTMADQFLTSEARLVG